MPPNLKERRKMAKHISMQNPWGKVVEAWRADLFAGKRREYILEEDREALKGLLNDAEFEKTYFPQPFIGNPSTAKVWIVPINPSASPWDKVDMFGDDPNVCWNELKKQHGKLRPLSEILIPRNIHFTALQRRQNLFCNALTLKNPIFYVLDSSFETLRQRTGGVSVHGTYNWWRRFLLNHACDGDFERTQNFFVAELFPYHHKQSQKINKYITKTEHFKYIKPLISEALKRGVTILIRKRSIIPILFDNLDSKILKASNLFVPKAKRPQNLYIKASHFIRYRDDVLTGAKRESAIKEAEAFLKSQFEG